MKKYPLIWYYRNQICNLQKKIKEVHLRYAIRSAKSSKNFEFDHFVEKETREYKKNIYNLKRKMCLIR